MIGAVHCLAAEPALGLAHPVGKSALSLLEDVGLAVFADNKMPAALALCLGLD